MRHHHTFTLKITVDCKCTCSNSHTIVWTRTLRLKRLAHTLYTRSLVARTCFCAQRGPLTHFAHLHACHIHAWLKCHEKRRCLSHECLCSLSRLHPSHDSLIFAVPWRSLRDHSRLRFHWQSHSHDLAVLSRPKSAGHAPLRTCTAKFGYLAKSDANTGYEPKEFDKITSVDDDTMLINNPTHNFSDFSKTTNENTRQFCVPTVFESSVFFTFLMMMLLFG